MKQLTLKIFTFQTLLFSETGTKFIFSGVKEGQLTLLPGHIPLISSLQASECKFHLKNDKIKRFQISRGILYFDNDNIKIICDEAKNLK